MKKKTPATRKKHKKWHPLPVFLGVIVSVLLITALVRSFVDRDSRDPASAVTSPSMQYQPQFTTPHTKLND